MAEQYAAPSSAIIVPGGGITYTGELTVSTDQRLQTAIELWATDETQVIYLSGRYSHNIVSPPKFTEAECMYREALKRGVAAIALQIEDQSCSTLENLIACKQRLRECGIYTVRAITQCSYIERLREIGHFVFGDEFGFDAVQVNETRYSERGNEIQGLYDFRSRCEADAILPGDDDALALLSAREAKLANERRLLRCAA